MAKDVACGMRSFLLFLHLAHSFFPSSRPASGGRASVCFRRCSTWQRTLSIRRYYPMCPFLYLYVSVGQVLKVLQSLATPQRTYEYPIFMASHFPFSSPALFDFLRESAVHSSFDFSSMFVFAWIIQPLPCSLFLLSVSFFFGLFTKARKENVTKKNCPAIAVIISF